MNNSTNDWLSPVLAQIFIDSGISFTVDPGLAGNAIKRAEEAIAKELMGCLPGYRMPRPGMEPIIPTSIKDRYLEHEDTGFNKALDEVRARLTAFIGKGKA